MSRVIGTAVLLVSLATLGGLALAQKQNVDTSRLKPLTEMGDSDYQGFKGGLYPGGKNDRPAEHERAGLVPGGAVTQSKSAS